jgi:hypothetical protein
MSAHPPTQTDPAEPTYSPDGVDLTLIRWMLSLTPQERLSVLQAHIDAIRSIRGDDVSDRD